MKVLGMLFIHALGRNDLCFYSSIDFCGINKSASEEYERDAYVPICSHSKNEI